MPRSTCEDDSGVCAADLLTALCLISDLGMGRPMDHALRRSVVAVGLAELLGLDSETRALAFCAGPVAWISDPLHDRGRHGGHAVEAEGSHCPCCVATDALAVGLGLPESVVETVEHAAERWDGRGEGGVGGERIPVAARLVGIAGVVEAFHRRGGPESARAAVASLRGTRFDPEIVDVFCEHAEHVCAGLGSPAAWDEVISSEPVLHRRFTSSQLDTALGAMGDFADSGSLCTVGHSRVVAELVAHCAATLGLHDPEATVARRAAHVHDLGQLGLPGPIWESGRALTVSSRERVRLHPYLTERALSSVDGLVPVAVVAHQHHERLDGSGYPWGVHGDALGHGARLVAAADYYRTKTEPRPHRDALAPRDAAKSAREEVRLGHLDGDAVEAVLVASGHTSGHRARRRRRAVAELTSREAEVLGLVAQGLSNKQVAVRLGISPKTVGNHVEHIYTKLEVNNRTLASVRATHDGLVDPGRQVRT